GQSTLAVTKSVPPHTRQVSGIRETPALRESLRPWGSPARPCARPPPYGRAQCARQPQPVIRPMSNMQRLPGLDAVRFYAATAVILFHLAPLSGLPLPAELRFIAQYFGFAVPLFYIA